MNEIPAQGRHKVFTRGESTLVHGTTRNAGETYTRSRADESRDFSGRTGLYTKGNSLENKIYIYVF